MTSAPSIPSEMQVEGYFFSLMGFVSYFVMGYVVLWTWGFKSFMDIGLYNKIIAGLLLSIGYYWIVKTKSKIVRKKNNLEFKTNDDHYFALYNNYGITYLHILLLFLKIEMKIVFPLSIISLILLIFVPIIYFKYQTTKKKITD